jgi:3',5'-cyclic-AMP phosphodiesterase
VTAHTIVHVSDPHLLADDLLLGAVDCERTLQRFAERVIASEIQPDAIVVTGDVADQAEPRAYEKACSILVPLAERLDAKLLWVMGNHDHRIIFSDHLLAGGPTNQVVDVAGLRIVALDSAVPGYHHGRIEDSSLAWLREVLSEPAEHGTVLALHHPPLDTDLGFLRILDLRNRAELAKVIRDTDVRVVLAGHWHLSASGEIAGVPVLVAGATSYSADPGAPVGSFVGVDAGQSYRVIELRETGVHSVVVPIVGEPGITLVNRTELTAADALDEAERDEQWSRFPITDLSRPGRT